MDPQTPVLVTDKERLDFANEKLGELIEFLKVVAGVCLVAVDVIEQTQTVNPDDDEPIKTSLVPRPSLKTIKGWVQPHRQVVELLPVEPVARVTST